MSNEFIGFQDGGPNSSDRADRDTTVPLNLSADTADDKKAKRTANDAENVELDRMKRVKSEQTEATDLSMKTTTTASLNRLNSHSVFPYYIIRRITLLCNVSLFRTTRRRAMNSSAVVFLGRKPNPNPGRWFFRTRPFPCFAAEICRPSRAH